MYTLRGRDLSGLVGGREASLASRVEQWAQDPSQAAGAEATSVRLPGGLGATPRAASWSARGGRARLLPTAEAPGPAPAEPRAEELQQLQRQNADLGARLRGLEQEVLQLQEQARAEAEARRQAEAREAALREQHQALAERTRPREELRRLNGELTARLRLLEKKAGRLQEQHRAEAEARARAEAREEALRRQNQELSDQIGAHAKELASLQRQGDVAQLVEGRVQAESREAVLRRQSEVLAAQVHRKDQELERLRKQVCESTAEPPSASALGQVSVQCKAPCCAPLLRMAKAGLNGEPLRELDALWAGRVFALLGEEIKSSRQALLDVFKKHRGPGATHLQESSFRELVREFLPKLSDDHVTRLLHFADRGGAGRLTFQEFLQAVGHDVQGRMGEEYFDHVMVRMEAAVARQGGLPAVFQLNDWYLHGTVPRARVLQILPSAVGLTRREAFDIATRFETKLSGEVDLRELNTAMQACASARLVSEEWVHKLFDEVTLSLHRQGKSIREGMHAAAAKRKMDREFFRGFLRLFQPSLKDSEADRVFTLICANTKKTGGTRPTVDFSDFFHIACQSTLGGTERKRLDASLPSESTERIALLLSRTAGSMAKAFDMLNPCLFLEEFQEALQALGFAPGADFKRLFNLLDVSRTGRISKADFVSLLERHVKDVHTLSYRADNVEQDVAARRIQRYVRYHQLRYELPDSDSPMESNFAKLAETQLDVFRREAGLKKESVPTTVFSKLVDDHQRVINRVLVLENEIDYLRRQVEFGAVGSRVVNSEEVRKLQSANRNLLHHFYCAQSAAAAGAAAPEPERHEPEAPAAPAEGQEEEAAASDLAAEAARWKEEAAELKREKRHLQLELGKGVVRLQRELEALAERTRASQEEPAAAPHALSAAQLAGGRSSSRRTALSVGFAAEGKPAEFRLSADARGGSRSPSRQGWEVQLDFQTQSHRVLKEALSAFAADRDVTKFLREVSGSSVVGRYVVRDVISVETDMIRLRCSDSYLQRHVCICLPISDTVDMRRVFMRRFCILAVLADVCEVQSVFHFPGFSEYLAFCVMELLQGAPLSSRLRACRGGACAPIPAHDAAQICDALLTGLEECHKRGITHLDLKPSAVWEMQQPSATVVKILDFGRAQVADAEALAPGAQAFFEEAGTCPPRPGGDDGRAQGPAQRPPPRLRVDAAAAEGTEVQLPAEGAEIAAWEAFAPFALLIGVGSPWYMSPARWCDFTLKHQKTDVTQPALRLWKEPGQFDQTPWVRSGEDEGDMDIITAREATESGLAFQATRPAPTFPDGAYFEVVLLKVWPPQQLSGCVDRHDGPVGFAVGFTRTPPHLNDARRCRARKQPNSWVVGYDGRFFENGQEVPTQDEASEDGREQMRDRRRLSAAQAAQPDVLGGTRSAQAHSQMAWPIGPMGFSLAELQRNDRLGVMATESGHLVLFVNDAMICKVKATNLSAREPLYPLVEICGVAREIGLVPRPRGPRGLEESHRAHDHMASTCERLAPHAETTYADIYAAAAIVQECFCSTARPTVPSAFLQLLSAVSSWIQQGCPEVALHGDMLLALTRWSKTSRVQSGLDPGIADVLQRVFSAAGAPPNVLGATGTICSARQLRMALNEKTGCRHVSPEFLGSHAKAVTQATNLRRFLHQGLRERDSAPQRLDAELWDIRPWTLSASHIRHVVLVLQSELEGHIWRVGISKLEANVPLELKLQLVKCFNRTLQTVNGDGDEPAPSSGSSRSTRRRPGIVGFHAVPSLQFESFPLPADACPVSFARLQEANAVGVVLHFVRRVSLGQGLSETPVGTAGAAQLAEALHGNVLLQELEAPGQGFGDEGAALLSDALQGGTRLRHLRLGGNGIGDAGAQALAAALRAPACELQLLDLAGNALGDSGCTVLAEAVQKNAHLCSLVLRRNGIGPDGATALADALMYNHALTELDLGQNSVDAAGAGALARATRVNVSLASLSLQGNSLDMRAAVCLAEALAGEPCEFPPNIDKPRFATRAAGARPEGARASWSPRNSAATLAANMLNDARSRANQGSCLQRLDLRRNSLGSTGAATLLEALRGSTRLTSISLAWNELGLEASAAVAELFRPGSQCALRELDLRDNRLGEFSALGRALEGMARHILERSGDGANSSKGSARSSSKRPSARGGSKEAPSQSRKSTQEEVLPRRGTLAPPGPDAIVVQESPAVHLRWLNIASCRIRASGVELIATAIPVFKNLEVLLMYNNPGLASRPGQDSAGAPEVAGLSALVRGLPPTLRHLSLGSCGIGSVGVVSVLRALKHGKSLELLDLSDNDCHESSDKDEQLFCDALIGAIVNLPSLRRLNLALNRIADDSVIRLAQVLCFEAPGVTVDVSVNKVSDDLIQAVRDWVANEAAGATAQDSGTDPDPSEVMPTTPRPTGRPTSATRWRRASVVSKVIVGASTSVSRSRGAPRSKYKSAAEALADHLSGAQHLLRGRLLL